MSAPIPSTAVAAEAEALADPSTDFSTALINKRTLIIRRFLRNKAATLGLILLILVILFAVFGNIINRGINYQTLDPLNIASPPSPDHWFGTNQAGADMFALLVNGTRKSLLIGFSVGIFTTFVAGIYGSALAYFGGWVNRIGLFLLEFMIMMPQLLLVAIVMAGRSGGWVLLAVLLLIFGWMGTARLVRSLTLSLVDREYVKAARYMGVSSFKIITRHIMPNIASLMVLNITQGIWIAILNEVSYSYIGIGVKLPDTSLGLLIAQASEALQAYPWMFWAPVLMLTAITGSLALMNDGIRDALDPTSQSGGRA
jgi:peptide/nickel transport system permease protein